MSLPELADLDGWLAKREANVPALRPAAAKQMIWAKGPAQTDWAVVFIHGFSATKEELRPLPDLVAQTLGGNLYFTRLAGHGQDGAAMGRARLADWDADVAEAIAIGRKAGRKVLLMGCSTGCPLIATAVARGAQAEAVVFVSANFGLRHRAAQLLLDMPFVRGWGPFVAGKERSFEPISPAHAAHWTVRYDTQAVFTMGEAVRAAKAANLEGIEAPVYMALCEEDEVVSPSQMRRAMARWGGPLTEDVLIQTPQDDALGHVMAGDIFSPQQTEPLARRIDAWIATL